MITECIMEKYFFEKDHPLSFRAKITEVAMTEYSSNNAWIYNGNNGNMNANNKNNTNNVRPVTEFQKNIKCQSYGVFR